MLSVPQQKSQIGNVGYFREDEQLKRLMRDKMRGESSSSSSATLSMANMCSNESGCGTAAYAMIPAERHPCYYAAADGVAADDNDDIIW